jgi:hypothetical protein
MLPIARLRHHAANAVHSPASQHGVFIPFAPFNLILGLFSFVFVCRDLVASRRRQHIVFGRRRLKLIVRHDEQDREARWVGGRTCFWRSLVLLTFR